MIIAREGEGEKVVATASEISPAAKGLTLIFEIVSRVRIRDFNGAEDISICVGLKFIRGN